VLLSGVQSCDFLTEKRRAVLPHYHSCTSVALGVFPCLLSRRCRAGRRNPWRESRQLRGFGFAELNPQKRPACGTPANRSATLGLADNCSISASPSWWGRISRLGSCLVVPKLPASLARARWLAVADLASELGSGWQHAASAMRRFCQTRRVRHFPTGPAVENQGFAFGTGADLRLGYSYARAFNPSPRAQSADACARSARNWVSSMTHCKSSQPTRSAGYIPHIRRRDETKDRPKAQRV
jgi:hypothetical protein